MMAGVRVENEHKYAIDDDDGQEEEFSNDENKVLSPLHIEGAGYRPPSSLFVSPICYARVCHRISAILLVITMFSGTCLVVLRHVFPTYLPSKLLGGSSNMANAVCLSEPLSWKAYLSGNRTSIDDLDLNRKAPAFSGNLADLHGAQGGFLWNEEDANTIKWRPQGISTISDSDGSRRRFAIVSWYGRKDQDYAKYGAKISFVDITKMHSIAALYQYRHVLLVDENWCTFPNVHAGGIEYHNKKIYVADSRKGEQKILIFDITKDLYEVPPSLRSELDDYRYVLRSTSSFHVPIKPSFISYDRDINKFVVGKYYHCGPTIGIHIDSDSCISRGDNQIVWFEEQEANLTHPQYCFPFFSEMQGVASLMVQFDTNSSAKDGKRSTRLYITSSYGPYAASHLHIVYNFDYTSCVESRGDQRWRSNEVKTLHYPAGLEDLHIQEASNNRLLWMLTEFGQRMVFATKLEDLESNF